MTGVFKVGLLGGGLQGVEAASLARWAGWSSTLADARPAPPAAALADRFRPGTLANPADLDRVFGDCDLVVPACEDPATWELLAAWAGRGGAPPVAFDRPAWRLSRDKAASKRLFENLGLPTPLDYPRAQFPLVAKPVAASGSRGVRLLEGPADLANFFPEGPGAGWVLEEYCPGPSYSLEVTGRPGAYRAWAVTQLAMDQAYDCRQVVFPADLDRAAEEELRALSLRLAEGLQLTGLMDVEVILTPRGFRILEIDARLPSQTPSAVYWATGENLLARLAELFGGPLQAERPLLNRPRAVIYEHIAATARGLEPVGEHRLSLAGPLRLEENFFGADLALTDQGEARFGWAATLIISGENLAEVRARRRETLARLGQSYPLSPLFFEPGAGA
ncbi:3-methylornithine--L-lysine ligase PylC [Deltaproteobacteria bacterium]|nr:3-methylornithine--L-lysine ligase PylC [Deltaproteobacteria bacterium]